MNINANTNARKVATAKLVSFKPVVGAKKVLIGIEGHYNVKRNNSL